MLEEATRPHLRLRRGRSPLERRAIDAHAQRLGLSVCRETRLVLGAGQTRGGFDGLKAAAQEAGNARVLGLEALAMLKPKRTLSSLAVSLGLRPQDDGRNLVRESIRSLDRATSGLRSLCERFWVAGELEAAQLLAVSREMSDAVAAVRTAVKELDHATAGDLRQLSRAYSTYLATFEQYRETYDEILEIRFPREGRSIVWLGKAEAKASDPLEHQARTAIESVRQLLGLGDLFITRKASHLA